MELAQKETDKELTTLKSVMPHEFMEQFDDVRAYKYKDVKVLVEHDSAPGWEPWIGSHKHVYFWVELENGYAVGFNENPSRGWSFPVVKLPKKVKI